MASGIRGEYEKYGVAEFYRRFGAIYRNPHEEIIHRSLEKVVDCWKLDLTRVLDLAAGSGEVSVLVRAMGAGAVDGIDPMTSEAYMARVGRPTEPFSFEDVAAGALGGRTYSLIVCSFALHLCEPSRLPGLCQQLALLAPIFLVVTPHKRPEIREEWGWTLRDELLIDRVRTRVYTAKG